MIKRFGWIAFLLVFAVCSEASKFRLQHQEETLRTIADKADAADTAVIRLQLEMMYLNSQALQRIVDATGVGQEWVRRMPTWPNS